MQRLQLKWWMPLSLLVISLLWSSDLSRRKFISLHQPLVVKAQKNSPPHIAFEALIESESTNKEWALIAKNPRQELATNKIYKFESNKDVIQLTEMVLTKSVEPISISQNRYANHHPMNQSSERTADSRDRGHLDSRTLPVQIQAALEPTAPPDNSWTESLSPAQQKRILLAQQKSEVLDQDWQDKSWSKVVERALSENQKGASSNSKKDQGLTTNVGTAKPAATADSQDEPAFIGSSVAISGPIEISGGLAFTNDHHIEVRRNNEGVVKELGRVNLQKGLYNITVEDSSGVLVAQLITREGRVIGEGQVRLSHVSKSGNQFLGPKLKLEPQISIASRVTSAYGDGHALPDQTIATFIKGAGDEKIDSTHLAGLDNVAKGSSTVMRVAGKGHLQTAQVVISGVESKTQLFSEQMISALESIIGEQKKISASNGHRVVWGQALLDGKPQVGIKVEIESDPNAQVVYLNELMIPDESLKATSTNGLYVFINVEPGFQSLLGLKDDAFFGYQNVQVEEGSVAIGNIESTTRMETVPLRVYDALSGESKPAKIIMQSISDEIVAEENALSIQLPKISRMGLMRVLPAGADYVPARYVYNDQETFIHAPLIQWSWLTNIKGYLRLDDLPTIGTVVGFVPEENFEVYLAGHENFDTRNIVYFDMQGRILEGKKGAAGGGFIIYNIPPDTHEVVVLGEKSRKIYSRIVPVDADSLSVLTYR